MVFQCLLLPEATEQYLRELFPTSLPHTGHWGNPTNILTCSEYPLQPNEKQGKCRSVNCDQMPINIFESRPQTLPSGDPVLPKPWFWNKTANRFRRWLLQATYETILLEFQVSTFNCSVMNGTWTSNLE